LQRVETFPVPEPALREAVLNALIHKDYSTGTPIQIRVYADKLTIWNTGQLPASWTVHKLIAVHSSQPFNPDLANVFFRAGEIEAWGRGIQRILEACREAGSPDPHFDYESTGIGVTFPFPEELVKRTNGKETAQEAPKKPPRNPQERILALLKERPTLTRRELAEQLGLTPDSVKHHLDQLRKAGRIRHVGPTKAGHWEVQG
jgi:ATP-dependent DNA helicase RecG